MDLDIVKIITKKIQTTFKAIEKLEVINESHMHSVPKNSQTHFKIILVSPEFENLSLVKRHQKIYSLLSDVKYHSLSMHLLTLSEYQNLNDLDSPLCSKK